MPKKLTYDYVKSYIESQGYQLLSEEYKNNSTKLKFKCNQNHIFEMTYNAFKQGQRCPICFNINYRAHNKLTYKEVKNYIESYGYKLLSTEYKNNKERLEIECPYWHQFKMRYNDFSRGHRCPICNNIQKSKNYKFSYSYVKKIIERENYKLLSKNYENCMEKLRLKCPVGHIFETKLSYFRSEVRCPICNKSYQSSKMENEIQNFVSRNYKGVISNNDKNIIINPSTNRKLELDIYLPELNKAIEFNGTYWHSFPNRMKCDKIKKEQCEKLGIKLLIINEQDWLDNKNSCLDTIKKYITK